MAERNHEVTKKTAALRCQGKHRRAGLVEKTVAGL